MKLLTILLYPFAMVYGLITRIRNRLYDLGYKPAAKFDLPVISVGNLVVGGTGKTPMIEHLIRLLQARHAIATLSRGYKRRTKGFRLATPEDTALTLGDEPYQFYKTFGEKIVVAVGEERAMAIPQILHKHPQTQVILLDDAFQHRKVKPSFQLLLSDYHAPFYKDFLLPAGRLRESRKGAERADAIIITKCPPGIQEDEMIDIEAGIRKYAAKPVFFTSIRYGELMPVNGMEMKADQVILVSGIATARSLVTHVAGNYKLVRHVEFPDHHLYTHNDLRMVRDLAARHNAAVLTTEKDAVKISSAEFQSLLAETPLFYWPIEIEFIKNGKDFDEMILNAAKNG